MGTELSAEAVFGEHCQPRCGIHGSSGPLIFCLAMLHHAGCAAGSRELRTGQSAPQGSAGGGQQEGK